MPEGQQPSDRQMLLALLRFGAADANEKVRVVEQYMEQCKLTGGPHVWNPYVEIMETLSRLTPFFGLNPESGIYSGIEKPAERMLENFPAIVDRTAFSSAAALELQVECKRLLEDLGTDNEAPLSFFDLMCYSCD